LARVVDQVPGLGPDAQRPGRPRPHSDHSTGGGPYDGIVTLVSSNPFDFTRPPGSGYDALRVTEHEMDEVMGFGSSLGALSDYPPQDLFSWSAPGTRSISTSDLRCFSIDDGDTDIVDFNQAYSLTKANRSALTTSAWVVHMPCGNFK